MDLLQYLRGRVQVKFRSADLQGAMTAMGKQGIGLLDVFVEDRLTASFWIERVHLQDVKDFAERWGAQAEIQKEVGFHRHITGLLKRPVLVAGFLGLLILSLWLPGRILFIRVEGNRSLSTRQILETASSCGIYFGAGRRDVRSEKVKNGLLEQMDSLSWAAVNTYGCTAVISVKERLQPVQKQEKGVVSSIVAARDGIVGSVTVLRGTGLCVPGQAVKAGQVLISGYTDCGLVIQATRAEGEVYGQTRRTLTVVCPTEIQTKVKKKEPTRKFSLIIGKKRINFGNNSRISGVNCDKIYVENYWVLPGGFVLPVALAVETWARYDLQQDSWDPDLNEAACNYLKGQMLSGNILRMDQVLSESEGLQTLQADFSCYEIIGITRIEERLSEHG